ncbi:hypothetical protein SAMN05421788_106207 [Filimonas lacunae]|uniref:Uncharacterized protein n=1 Tax=Filimonas lacunae TaxID=477680 RepID=A0A1N7QQ35_9BACT|nr:hypothetical protein [Filimonas lacunae]SIT24894.1 hypothetical protein SAMN05421788_106207 [Filimonas lacunae]
MNKNALLSFFKILTVVLALVLPYPVSGFPIPLGFGFYLLALMGFPTIIFLILYFGAILYFSASELGRYSSRADACICIVIILISFILLAFSLGDFICYASALIWALLAAYVLVTATVFAITLRKIHTLLTLRLMNSKE